MTRPGNYPGQAATYDVTRRASPVLVDVLAGFLGPGAGRRLLDVAGGTGNYSRALKERGFDVVIVDVEREMLARSVVKIGAGRQVLGDAESLPVRGGSVDCATLVQALHLMEDPPRAIAEVRRVLREGPFVLQVYTLENLRACFVFEYFAGSNPAPGIHPPGGVVEGWLRSEGFGRVERKVYTYPDTTDANLHSLHTDAAKLADRRYLMNTSFFQRIAEPAQRMGLARLARDLRSGLLAERVRRSMDEASRSGHGTVFAAWP